MSQHDSKSLLKDLEEIRQSLDRIARSKPAIPLLDEIVEKREPTHVNPNNPFLSSQSLSELIRIRNEAEARSAEELANMEPLRPIGEIVRKADLQASPRPDPELIKDQLETLFSTWIDDAVENYLRLFEQDLRNRLQQDFRKLVAQWFRDSDLPVPEDFLDRPENETGPKGASPTEGSEDRDPGR